MRTLIYSFWSIVACMVFLLMTGCANSLKKQVAADLNAMVQTGDCETTCALLKDYIATKLK